MLSKFCRGCTSEDLAKLDFLARPRSVAQAAQAAEEEDIHDSQDVRRVRRRMTTKTKPSENELREINLMINLKNKTSQLRCDIGSLRTVGLREMRPAVEKFRFLKEFVGSALQNITPSAQNRLHQNLIEMMPEDAQVLTIKVGTACSGSDHWLSGLRHLSAAIKAQFRLSANFKHVYAFEIVESKRLFLSSNWTPQYLFGSVCDFRDDKTAHDYISQKRVQVPFVDWLISGPSCKDASRLSLRHAERLQVVDTASHTTGSTIKGVVHIVQVMWPSRVFLENVPSLKDKPNAQSRSNFDALRLIHLGRGIRSSGRFQFAGVYII